MARRHLLIGSGPAAMSAAETIRSRDDGAEIVVVGAEPHGYYSRPGLAYYLAKEVPEKRLFPFTPAGHRPSERPAGARASGPHRSRRAPGDPARAAESFPTIAC